MLGYHTHGYGHGFDDPNWNPADPSRPEYDPSSIPEVVESDKDLKIDGGFNVDDDFLPYTPARPLRPVPSP